MMLKAGISVKDVTPQQPLLMCGYPEPKDRTSTGVHDPLLASVYYLSDEATEILLVSIDLCYVSKTRSAKIRKAVADQVGVPAQNISLAFTHTHSGPMASPKPFVCSAQPEECYPEYLDFVQGAIVTAAKEAKSSAFDAQVGFGIASCGKEQGMGGNRHAAEGPQDPAVSVFAIRSMDGTLKGAIVNYSMHPTVLHAGNTLLTGDFPYYIREYLEGLYPGGAFSYTMGAAGDQSTRYFRTAQNFDEAKRIGFLLGEAAQQAISQMEFSSDAPITVAIGSVIPPFKDIPSYQDAVASAKKAKEEYDALIAEGAPYPVCRSAECTVIGTDSMVTTAQIAETAGLDNMRAQSLPIELQLIKIGDAALLGFSAEAFVEIGLRIKKDSPFPFTALSFLTNGSTLGYVCTDEAYSEFCYEAMGSQFTFGAGKAVADEALRLLRSVQ